jgi:hypothetical protein
MSTTIQNKVTFTKEEEALIVSIRKQQELDTVLSGNQPLVDLVMSCLNDPKANGNRSFDAYKLMAVIKSITGMENLKVYSNCIFQDNSK